MKKSEKDRLLARRREKEREKIEGTRICNGCGEKKVLASEFYKEGHKYKHFCKICMRKKFIICRNCGNKLPLTDEYFNRGPHGKFMKRCKICETADSDVCGQCGIRKPLTEEFWRKIENGFSRPCKVCANERAVEYREEHREEIRESSRNSSRKFCLENPERRKESMKKYREKHKDDPEYKERVKEANKKHRLKNIEKCKEHEKDDLGIRICPGCSLLKPLTTEFFHRNYAYSDGFNKKCKICALKDCKEYRENNRDKTREATKKSYLKEKVKHPEQIKERQKRKYLKDKEKPESKLRWCVRSRIYHCLRERKGGQSVLKYLGYSIEDLKNHLESLFEPWMTWENWGKYDPKTWDDNDSSTWRWNMDHIKPHDDFRYDSMDCQEFRDCWSLSNLRPLSAKQNIIEGTMKIRHSKKKAA